MSNVRIELLSSGVQELMKSPEMQALLQEKANEVAERCNGEYETDVYVGKTRANASIKTHDWATYYRNLKDNELLKALR